MCHSQISQYEKNSKAWIQQKPHLIKVSKCHNSSNRWLVLFGKSMTVGSLSPPHRFTLVCLNCDLLVDSSGGDLMSKHLTDRPSHICRVIQQKGTLLCCCCPVQDVSPNSFSGSLSLVVFVFFVKTQTDGKTNERVRVETHEHINVALTCR